MSTLAQDSAALESAASAADEALRLEREALSVLRDGWTGDAADAAADFIDAHCREGEAVVSALRHAAAVLAAWSDSADVPVDHMDAGLAERPPSNFSAAAPPAAAAPAPSMNWPAGGTGNLPDAGGTIAGLIAQIVDALSVDPGSIDTAGVDAPADAVTATAPGAPEQTPPADPVAEGPPAPPAAPDPAPVIPPAEPAAPPAAELPPPIPEQPPPAEVPVAERTPCEIAADELPQAGE